MHSDEKPTYVITIEGHLRSNWSVWFDGFEIESVIDSDGRAISIIKGAVADQSELFGVLLRLSNLNLHLISVNQI